jgi:sensor histidine kinase YesM
MMRYSASGSDHPVTIADELRHAASYAKLMRVRFVDELTFTFDVPAELLPVLLPRLTIQPLLENCAKHATTNAPPWQISITGKSEGATWQITVSDNGAGFTPEALAKLAHQFTSTSDAPPALEVEGMGLMNIHERLVLFYGAKALFEFGNHAEGGAYVTIGGPMMPVKGGCSGADNL